MKISGALLAAILAASVVTWALIFFLTPGDPLTPAETLVVVGICAALVLLARWIWSCIWKLRGRHAEKA